MLKLLVILFTFFLRLGWGGTNTNNNKCNSTRLKKKNETYKFYSLFLQTVLQKEEDVSKINEGPENHLNDYLSPFFQIQLFCKNAPFRLWPAYYLGITIEAGQRQYQKNDMFHSCNYRL